MNLIRLRTAVLEQHIPNGRVLSIHAARRNADAVVQVDVLLAQPLRLGALADEGGVDLSGVRLLVLDEADKLFDMGFTEQVRSSLPCACNAP